MVIPEDLPPHPEGFNSRFCLLMDAHANSVYKAIGGIDLFEILRGLTIDTNFTLHKTNPKWVTDWSWGNAYRDYHRFSFLANSNVVFRITQNDVVVFRKNRHPEKPYRATHPSKHPDHHYLISEITHRGTQNRMSFVEAESYFNALVANF